MKSYSVPKEFANLARQLFPEAFHPCNQHKSGTQRAIRGVGLRMRRSPIAQELIAEKMLEIAVLGRNGKSLNFEHLIQEQKEILGAKPLGQWGGVAEIGQKYRELGLLRFG